MLQGSSMVKVTAGSCGRWRPSLDLRGVLFVPEGALASLAEAANAEAPGGRGHRLVPVPQNLQPGQRAAVV